MLRNGFHTAACNSKYLHVHSLIFIHFVFVSEMWSRTVFTRARSFGRCFYSVHVPVRSSIFRYCGTPHPPNFEKCDSLVAHLAIPPLQTSNTLNFNGSRSYSTSSHQQKIPSDDVVLYDVNEATGIATITLNNPQKRNPLSCGVLDSLNGIVDEIEEDLRASRAEHHPSRVRVVVIKSTGPVFCSGHDFKDFTMDKGKDFHKKVLAACTRLNLRLQSVCPPTIAMVDGLATAAGCQLACSCDLVVATDTSRFCVPGSRNGGFCHTPGVSLSNKIHKRKALELLLLGDDLPAVEAARLGLVSTS